MKIGQCGMRVHPFVGIGSDERPSGAALSRKLPVNQELNAESGVRSGHFRHMTADGREHRFPFGAGAHG